MADQLITDKWGSLVVANVPADALPYVEEAWVAGWVDNYMEGVNTNEEEQLHAARHMAQVEWDFTMGVECRNVGHKWSGW